MSPGLTICMFVRNSFEFDARVEREASALADGGADVTVIALMDADGTPRREVRGKIRVRRISRWFWLVDRMRAAWISRARPDGGAPPMRDAMTRSLSTMQHGWTAVRTIGPIARIRDFMIAARMAAVGARVGADVYHAHDLNTLAAASWAVRLRGGRPKLIYDSHEIAPHQSGLGDPAAIEAKERRLIRRADAVIHVTPMRARWAADTYRIPTPAVVRNVPDIPEHLPGFDFGFGDGKKVLLHAGGIQPERGLEALINALPLLDDGFALAFVGFGRLQPELEQRSKLLGITDRVLFTGAVPHERLLAATGAAWCGFSLLIDTGPNHRYSLPNKLFEAVALGVPVVVSDNPEIAEFVRDHGVGEVCDPTDAESVAAAVRRLAARYEDARAAAVAVAPTSRWVRERERLLELYGSVLNA